LIVASHTYISDPRAVKALAHPIRAQVLGALQDRVASPNELSRELGVSLGSVSYHVQRLLGLGFLKLVRKTPRRGAVEHYYTAIARPRVTDAAWGGVPPIVKQAAVSAALEHVAKHVNAAASFGGFDLPDAHLTRSPVVVDAQGWSELAADLLAMTERVQRIAAESAERLAAGDRDGETEASVVLMLFRPAPGGPQPAESAQDEHRHRRSTGSGSPP
jgi:DNA-binding transcriptional ArsR family regulator